MAFIFGIFLRSETGADPGLLKGGGGGRGGTTSANGASFVGVSGAISIPSILRLISYSFNTNFLLVNFAIVKKTTKKATISKIRCRLGGLGQRMRPFGESLFVVGIISSQVCQSKMVHKPSFERNYK